MRYINRYAACLFLVFGFYYFCNFVQFLFLDDKPKSPAELFQDFNSLKLKVSYLQNLVDKKQNDIDALKTAFTSNVEYYNNLVEKQKNILNQLKNSSGYFYNNLNIYSQNSDQKLEENAKTLSSEFINNSSISDKDPSLELIEQDIDFTRIFDFLPHLSGKKKSTQPKFKLSKNRYASFVIGIPTTKREKTSYLFETLKSLLDAMNELEKSEALIVIMIAEIDDQAYIQSTIESLTKVFRFETDSGLIEIIVPSSEYYPDLNNVKDDVVFNDSKDRVKWRTKQNYDFAYLMTYSQKRAKYYLQIEDDVIVKSGFLTIIKDFIKQQKTDTWIVIEFSQLGFIGKLFKSNNLPMFVNFFLIFAMDKPCDWLYDSALDVRICNPEKGNAHCIRSKSSLKLTYKPSLFQHVGVHSSLKGKTQKLKDKEFGKQGLIRAHDNPIAKVTTSLKTYMKHTLESAYLGQNYFWAMAPAKNDHLLFEFQEPVKIYKYYVKSGNPDHPDDKLYNATFQIQTTKKIEPSQLPVEFKEIEDGYYIINTFSGALGIVTGHINPEVTGPISKIRIVIPNACETWIIISEIEFSTKFIQEKK